MDARAVFVIFNFFGPPPRRPIPGAICRLPPNASFSFPWAAVSTPATARYVWSPVYVNALVLRDRATGSPGTLDERLWAQQDANFNVTALVDGTGAVVERYVYDPYGAVTIYSPDYCTVRSSSSYAMNILFQGMRYDATSGLDEANERWYSPTLQRWIGLDPSSYQAGDDNLYRSFANSPINLLDPSGLAVKVFWIQGTTPAGQKKTDGLYVNIIKPLILVFKNQAVQWHEFKTGVLTGQALNKREAGRNVEAAIVKEQKKCEGKDTFVLIGYSWGALTALLALRHSQIARNGRTIEPPTFKINVVCLIDPVQANLGANPFTNAKIRNPNNPTQQINAIYGNFDKGYNWFQQVDQGMSFGFGVKLWGVKVDDARFTNTQYFAKDFKSPGAAHSEIVQKPEIREKIEKVIKSLHQ